jgi:hypothetical protein
MPIVSNSPVWLVLRRYTTVRDEITSLSIKKIKNLSQLFKIITILFIKVNVKVTLEQATKAQRGSRGVALLFS